MAYIINPSEWEQDGEEKFSYFDENLAMRVILERETPNKHSRVWERYYYADAWVLKADSGTDFDENNCFFYDALSKDYSNPPRLQVASKAFFFDDNDTLKPVELPEWLIERMRFCLEQDERAYGDCNEWVQEHYGETYASYQDLLDNVWSWYARRYTNGGQYSDGAEAIIYAGEQMGDITRHGDGTYSIG